MRATPPRYWEIDCLRGLAVTLMLVSNLLFDLFFFAGRAQLQSGVLDWFARGIAGLFILLAGLSLSLRRVRGGSLAQVCRRGGILLGLGLVVSLATRLAAGEQMVVFGVLHLIGLGLILAWPLLGRPWLALATGLAVLFLALPVGRLRLDSPWLLWLGLRTPDFASVDYTPLIPWLGPLLIGTWLGHVLYPDGRPRWPVPEAAGRILPMRVLTWAGRHSLIIYLAHQPLFLGALFLLSRISP